MKVRPHELGVAGNAMVAAVSGPQSELNEVKPWFNFIKCKLIGIGVLAPKYGLIIPKPTVEQQMTNKASAFACFSSSQEAKAFTNKAIIGCRLREVA